MSSRQGRLIRMELSMIFLLLAVIISVISIGTIILGSSWIRKSGKYTLCAYKVHCKNKTCTKVAKGLLKELKCDFVGIHTMPKFTGKLSFKTEKGSNINVNGFVK